MGKHKISVSREELVLAFSQWYCDYLRNPDSFNNYDDKDYDRSSYADSSANALIAYINKVQEKV